MGQSQSQSQSRYTHNHDGPYFGGHYPGDFSIRRRPPDLNKPLPNLPPRSVRFGAPPPAWQFYRQAPPWDNTANTRYCHMSLNQGYQNAPPPAYSVLPGGKSG
ncbi:MAG: hypothetical protein TREMPRED_005620, partial [Tremellales sp. Tagirdzhanova-0007]